MTTWWYTASSPLEKRGLHLPLLPHMLRNHFGSYLCEWISVVCPKGFRMRLQHYSLSMLDPSIASLFHTTSTKHLTFTYWWCLTHRNIRSVLLDSRRHFFHHADESIIRLTFSWEAAGKAENVGSRTCSSVVFRDYPRNGPQIPQLDEETGRIVQGIRGGFWVIETALVYYTWGDEFEENPHPLPFRTLLDFKGNLNYLPPHDFRGLASCFLILRFHSSSPCGKHHCPLCLKWSSICRVRSWSIEPRWRINSTVVNSREGLRIQVKKKKHSVHCDNIFKSN